MLAGCSTGGDLAWTLALGNPQRVRGAVVMSSRASYRAGALAADRLLDSDADTARRAPGPHATLRLCEGDLDRVVRWLGTPASGAHI